MARKKKEHGENSVTDMRAKFVLPIEYWDAQIKEGKMGGACRIHTNGMKTRREDTT
jgi:hypothetical protein